MKVVKLFVGFILFVSISVIGIVNYLQNAEPYTRIGEKYAAPIRSLKWFVYNNTIDIKSCGFNKPTTDDAIILDFSNNDLKYNDSILSIVKNEATYFDDNLKDWKKTHLIYDKRRYEIKYRFHGSYSYYSKQGRFSLKIKSKDFIKGTKDFSLLTGFITGNFTDIFLAIQEQNLNLICPDPGSIVLANINGTTEDCWFTRDISDKYLKAKYSLNNFHVFERSDNWKRNGGPHFSELDKFYYYLDEEGLESQAPLFRKYKEFMTSYDSSLENAKKNIDYSYYGRFLASLYFFYDPHHIQGDNNKLLYNYETDMIYPIARNEGVFERIPNVLDFDEGLFHINGRNSATFNFYRKAVCNDSIRYYRDIELSRMIKAKSKMLLELDSIYFKSYELSKYYNVTFMNIRYQYEKLKKVIEENANTINNYLNNGEVIIAYNLLANEMLISTDYRVPLILYDNVNSTNYSIKGVDFEYKNNKIRLNFSENHFHSPTKISKDAITIVNTITGDTIPTQNIIFNYF